MSSFSTKNLLLLLFFSSILFFSCEMQVGFTPDDIKLVTNKTSIKANGIDSVQFTLTAKGKVISSDYAIMQKETETVFRKELFTTRSATTHTFYALYQNIKSNEVTIEATPLMLVLQFDKEQIRANNTDQVTLTVTEEDIDVTSYSTFYYLLEGDTIAMEGNTFTTTLSGAYTFLATYKERQVAASAPVTVATEQVTLNTDLQQFKADGKETIHFTVDADGVDVTSMATIHYTRDSVITLAKPLFSTKRAATYTFYATYNAVESPGLTLEADYVERFFQKEHLIMAFTSNNSKNGPYATAAIKELQEVMPNVHGLALHVQNHQCYSRLAGVLKESNNSLSPQDDFPSLRIDLEEITAMYWGGMTSRLSNLINKNNKYYGPPQTGIALESETLGKTIQFKAKVQTNNAGKYRIFAYIVEEKVKFQQHIGLGEYGDATFDHNAIHHFVGTYTINEGDPLNGTDLGYIDRGDEVERTFIIDTSGLDVGRKVKMGNCRVIAYTFREFYGRYTIDNVTSCPVDGSVDFKFIKK